MSGTLSYSWLFRLLLLLMALALVPCTSGAQRLDMKVLGKAKRIELPFILENDFIVLPVLVNNVVPLRFILDTGAENTVLLEKQVTDLLDISYRRTFEVRGADVDSVLTAYLATGVNLRIANRLLARNRSMLVLEKNYFNFERITGTNIHGILGADFLMRFSVEFDFKKNVVILHEPHKFKPSNRHVEIPATFIRNRPYLELPIRVNAQEETTRKILLDSGAGLTLLLHTFGDSTDVDLPVQTIPAYIADGLGGKLEGSVGRCREVALAGKSLTNVVSYFQPLDTTGLDFLNGREGIIGNRLMKRFNVAIDYVQEKVYFRPEGRSWKAKFRYDRSGIAIVAGGANLRTYTVSNVVKESPAGEAGVQVGDRIVGMNGTSATFLSLGNIIRKLEGKPGKRIRLRLRRQGKYVEVEFRLRDLI
ncbi:PDZ domain-containing protein [Lewinella sp. W8]|nr:PDZ domain-containing protein [Lewinella sp. W8]